MERGFGQANLGMPMEAQMGMPMEAAGYANKRPRMEMMGEGPSEAEILQLVAQRETMRQARCFAESDAIREELRSMGVELYDKEKEWRSRDGRRGTLFTAGPAECMMSDMEVQELVREREDARKSKDWDRADALRAELRSKGVELNDKESTWCTSGGRSGFYSGAPQGGTGVSGAAVRKLVAERERLRAAQDFDSADELRRQLSSLGVEVFDNERLWRSADGQQGVIITGGHEVDCRLADPEIIARVMKREEARTARNWPQADSIRDELRSEGVELLDNQKVWCTTDGRHGSYAGTSVVPSGGGGNAPRPTLSSDMAVRVAAGLASLLTPQAQPQRGGGVQNPQLALPSSNVTASPSTQTFSTASIIALVAGRERAREKHDWEAADAIRSDLRSHGVDVWDKEKVWRANDGRSGVIDRPLNAA